MSSSTETIVKALRVLAREIQSDDGVANAAIAEAADRIEQLDDYIKRLEEKYESRWKLAESAIGSCAEMSYQIKRLEEAGDDMVKNGWNEPHLAGKWRKAKEAKP